METLELKKVSIVLRRILGAKLEIKEYIIEEADKLFCQYGFKSVTMDDIAKQLGMSKKTIYQHFIDKDELVNILIRQKLETQDCMMGELLQHSENAVQEVIFAVTNMHDLLSNMNARLFFDLQKYHPKAWLYFKNFRDNKLYDVIYSNLLRGLKEGVFREELKPDIITRMRLEQVDLMFNNHDGYTNNQYSLAEVMVEITEHFLYGICNAKGNKLIDKYIKKGLLKHKQKNKEAI